MQEYANNGRGILVPAAIGVKGVITGQIIRGGHYDGHGEWHRGSEIVDEFVDTNLVTNQGLNDVLGVYFNSVAQKTSWFLGVFEGNYTPLASDTAAGIAAASTECTAYTSSTRPAWTNAAASSQSITNSANKASFVFNATKTIYGAFLISNSTKSGTSGTLWSAARFSASKAVVNLDELLLTYTFTASSV